MKRRSAIEKRGRLWALLSPAGTLVALMAYRKGAVEVARRLGWKPKVA